MCPALRSNGFSSGVPLTHLRPWVSLTIRGTLSSGIILEIFCRKFHLFSRQCVLLVPRTRFRLRPGKLFGPTTFYGILKI